MGLVLGDIGSGWQSHRPGAWQGLSWWGRGPELPWPRYLVAQPVRDLSFPTYPSQAGGKRVKKPGLKVQTRWEWFLQPPERGRGTLAPFAGTRVRKAFLRLRV